MPGKIFGSIGTDGVVSAAEGVANIIDQFVETDDEKRAAEATAAEAELETRTRQTMKKIRSEAKNAPVPPPKERKAPQRVFRSISRFVRDPNVISWVLFGAQGICEVCGQQAPFERADNEPYLEVHYVRPLAEGGPDTTNNGIACCPNCHRRLHYGIGQDKLRFNVISRIDRLGLGLITSRQ
jgi:5-methylcytosine-specific restriction enzyme A